LYLKRNELAARASLVMYTRRGSDPTALTTGVL